MRLVQHHTMPLLCSPAAEAPLALQPQIWPADGLDRIT
jgi:hypothetical protein